MNDSTPIIPLSRDAAVSLRIAHLQMLQGAAARMSGYSASVKNFGIAIVAGLLAYYSQQPDNRVYLFAVCSIIALGLLDIRYLRCEEAYRRLFDDIRQRPVTTATDFCIDPNLDEHPLLTVASSWSITHFYLPMLSGLAAVYVVLEIWPLIRW